MSKHTSRFVDRPKPPTCLHVLGQPLVDAIYAEARELLEQRDALLAACERLISEADTGVFRLDDCPSTIATVIDEDIRDAVAKAQGKS